MRLYVSGPMTGIPNYNFAAFQATTVTLRGMGHEVWSPAEMDAEEGVAPDPEGKTDDMEKYAGYLARDIRVLAEERIEGIVVLPGWMNSGGAITEVAFAQALHLPVFVLEDLTLYELVAPIVPLQRFEVGEAENTEDDRVQDIEDSADQAFLNSRALNRPSRRDEEHLVQDDATGGQKGQKISRFDLIPPEVEDEFARVYGMGAIKYSDLNYLKGYPWRLSIGAAERHINLWKRGESYDAESGLHHLAHAMWHMATLMMFEWYGLGTDNRLDGQITRGEQYDEDE